MIPEINFLYFRLPLYVDTVLDMSASLMNVRRDEHNYNNEDDIEKFISIIEKKFGK